jgi:hypothetical protein
VPEGLERSVGIGAALATLSTLRRRDGSCLCFRFSMSAPISMMRRLLFSQRTTVLGVMAAGRWLQGMQRGQVKGRVGFFVEEASGGSRCL